MFAGRRITKSRRFVDTKAAIAGGANVAIGYALVLVVGTFVVGVGAGNAAAGASLGPSLVMSALMGAVYGGVFGVVGGYWGSV